MTRKPTAQFSCGRPGAQHRRGSSVPEQRRGDYIDFRAPIDAAGERAQLDHDHEDNIARLGARKPGAERKARDATSTSATEHWHAHHRRPKSHFRTDARFDARGRNAG